jgi:hypothetical protein
MAMSKIAVFEPAMCCSTGVCGPSVDPVLPRFAADLDWLRRQGVEVERFNLAQQPADFAANAAVVGALQEFGNESLPLILVDDRIVSRGSYPERDELARLAGIDVADAQDGEPSSCCSPEPLVPIGRAGRSSGGCC